MFKKLLLLTVIGIIGLACAARAAAQEKADRSDILARKTAEQFMKAMTAEDIAAVMKVAEVPFFWDGTQNIKDRKDLKMAITGVFKKKDLTQLKFEIKAVHRYAKVRQKFREKERTLLKEVLDKDDRIVVVTVKSQGRQEGLAVLIRIRGGRANVAGFRD